MNTGFEQSQEVGRMWLQFMTRMATAGLVIDPEHGPSQAPRRMRDATLAALGEQADQYMRSPQFLEAMKQSLDASIGFRRQLNEFFTHAHHAVQGVAAQDVDALLQSVRHLETRVLDRVEELINKLDDVERRLQAIEEGANGTGRKEDGGDGGSSRGSGGAAPVETT